MEKLSVKICVGTSCYVQGGSELTGLEKAIPVSWKELVTVEGCVCLEACRKYRDQKPPFVLVGDRLISEATTDKVLAVLRGILT